MQTATVAESASKSTDIPLEDLLMGAIINTYWTSYLMRTQKGALGTQKEGPDHPVCPVDRFVK